MSDDDKPDDNVIKFPTKDLSKEINTPYVLSEIKTDRVPELVDPKDAEREVRKREDYVSNQELVKAVERKAPLVEISDVILKEMVEDITYLKYERKVAAKAGKPTSFISVARITALKDLINVMVKMRDEMRSERTDLNSPQFKKILHLWMELTYESMKKAGLDESMIEIVFKQLEADISDWTTKVAELV